MAAIEIKLPFLFRLKICSHVLVILFNIPLICLLKYSYNFFPPKLLLRFVCWHSIPISVFCYLVSNSLHTFRAVCVLIKLLSPWWHHNVRFYEASQFFFPVKIINNFCNFFFDIQIFMCVIYCVIFNLQYSTLLENIGNNLFCFCHFLCL